MLNNLNANQYQNVYLACGYTDLRLGIDGLASIVQSQFNLNPFQKRTLFLFCGRRADRIKGLLWEGLSAVFCYPHIFSKNLHLAATLANLRRKMCG